MTVGLPGVGIGGIFYLASALLMPFRSLVATVMGREARWSIAVRQSLIALLTMGAVWATVHAIAWLITVISPAVLDGASSGAASAVQLPNAWRTAVAFGSIGTLVLALTVVEALRLILPRRPTPRALLSAPPAEKQSAA